MTTYPMLQAIVSHGNRLAIAFGLSPVIAALVAVAFGWSPWWLAAGALAGIVVWGLAKSYAELVALISDMMLPK